MSRSHLRPLERTVLRLADEGMSETEIAWRFRRSPGHIQRVLDLTRLPRTGGRSDATAPGALRPIERIIMRARERGADRSETAARLRRSPDYVARVEMYASYKLSGAGAGK